MSAGSATEAMRARVAELERELSALRTFLGAGDAGGVEAAAPEELLLCGTAGHTLAVSLACIREVLPAARLMPLPDADPSVLGALNLRGSPLVVYDLGRRLGAPASPLDRTDLILACEIDGRRLGLKIAEAMDVARAVVTEMAEHTEPELDHALLRGAVVHGEETVVVLDLAALAQGTAGTGRAR